MRKIITFTAVLLILSMLPMALFSCNSGSENPTAEQSEKPTEAPKPTKKPAATEAPLEGTTYNVTDIVDKLKINGRHEVTESGITCDNVGSGIEFQGVMKGKVYVTIRCNNSKGYFTAYVDGVRQETRFDVSLGRKGETIEIADLGQTEGEHHIRIVKQTESRYATAEYKSITIDGELGEAPANKDIYIEFVGSSLCCGMGNLGWPEMGWQSSQTSEYEDGTQGFAFMAAEKLGADCSILGVSGMGLAKTWFPPLTLMKYFAAQSYYRDQAAKFDFESNRTPDVIVLNVGKNDGQLNGNLTPSTDAEFVAAAREILSTVREKYGEELPIIWAYDIYEAHRMNLIEPILEELGGEEAGYYACQVTSNRDGGDYHTDLKGHVQAAEDLYTFMESKDFMGLPVGE